MRSTWVISPFWMVTVRTSRFPLLRASAPETERTVPETASKVPSSVTCAASVSYTHLLDEAVSEEEMPSSSSSCSKKDETGDSPVASLLTALSLEAAALEGPSASPPGRAEDGTELACASDTGVLFRIPVRIKAAATITTKTMAAAS